nr:MAG TPA: transcriptional regulator [Crassvirales sp.]
MILFSLNIANGTSAQYYAADGSIQTLEKLSNTEIDSVFA